jgi:anaerobic magnesium-protoporphyrin IX monomethyl ester cyclase
MSCPLDILFTPSFFNPTETCSLSHVWSKKNEVEQINSNIMIVFPPTTEARLFPYLSLPMLTSYLRHVNVHVTQRDFNIELCHRLFSRERLADYLHLHDDPEQQELKQVYRLEMARYLLEHQEHYARVVFDKQSESKSEAIDAARFVRQGVELLLEGSVLQAQLTSLETISQVVQRYDDRAEHDLAARVQYDMLAEALANEQPRVFGISIAYYSQLLPSLLMAKWVKQLAPETFVIMGGQQMMLRHEAFAELPAVRQYVDALGIGAGEETMLQLHRFLSGEGEQTDVPNMVWMGAWDVEKGTQLRGPLSRTVHLKDVPPPDFSDLPYKQYLHYEFNLPLITCVGCYWGRCIFCSYGNRSHRENNYQQKTASQLADECQHLIETYHVQRINFVDENTNIRLVLNAMRTLNRRGIFVHFATRNRMEESLLDKAFVRELKDRGCVLMSSGYETNSQRLLDLMDKGVNAEHYQTIIDNLHEAGIPLQLSVMGGILDETPEEVAASESFLQKNADKIGIDVMQMLVAEPKTYLVENEESYPIHLHESWDELRGNQLLNYGMGRMGNDFAYEDGSTFQERLDRFLSIYRNVQPQNNLNLPPHMKQRGEESTADQVREVELHPWIKVVQASVKSNQPPQSIIADLLWQRFYPLPSGIRHAQGRLVADEHDAQGAAYLRKFIQNGLGSSRAAEKEQVR